MTHSDQQRIALHSGQYVDAVSNVPISRLTRLIPLLDLRPEYRVVDFGCGSGAFLRLVHRQVQSYDGVDFSPDFIAEAERLSNAAGITNATFHCEDIVAFCAEHTDEFNVVSALDFSEHIDDGAFIAIFKGAYRILKPGGNLYIYTPNLDFFWERMKDIGLAKQFPQHIAVRNHPHHVFLLGKCGFQEEDITHCMLPHFNVLRFAHPFRRLPWIGHWFEAKLFYRCQKQASLRIR